MYKRITIILLMIIILLPVIAQDVDPDAVTTANSQITEVRLNGFEDASFWKVSMSMDQGIITKRTIMGVPKDVSSDVYKERDEKYGIPNTYAKQKVLGIKVEFISRGYNWFTVMPVKPIVIEGICQSISCWVIGRNYRHWLKVILKDFNGNNRFLWVDKLNFIGWKEMKVSIPEVIEQQDYHFPEKVGIKFNGFLVECDPMETYGTYYIYFDELRAVTDLFNLKVVDTYDLADDW
ncbi:MAG: flagellar filament outer layer protein FlaA [Spirochaetes bacterium]|nr:flagellar filament outer layer protein FlaA [Spirochaetota bacterium]